MQQFEMPRFYMPFEARCNPNVDAAREHSKAWAWRMGMLRSAQTKKTAQDSFTWVEQEFDATDSALFGAYYHPDAPIDGHCQLVRSDERWRSFSAWLRRDGRVLRVVQAAVVSLVTSFQVLKRLVISRRYSWAWSR